VDPTVDRFIAYFVAAMIVAITLQERTRLGAALRCYAAITGRQAITGILLAITTFVLAAVGMSFTPEFLQWGWPSLFGGTAGNAILAPASRAVPAPASGGVLLSGLAFLVLLSVVMPLLVRGEEMLFRAGVTTPGRMAANSALFGLMHLLVGIPLFAGFVLMVPGYAFATIYRHAHLDARAAGESESAAREAGVDSSMSVHLAYNLFFLALIALALLLLLLRQFA